MLIEDYWLDGAAYYVRFLVTDGRCIEKELVFPLEMSEYEVESTVKECFNKVVDVISVEHLYDVLCMKKMMYTI